MDRLKEAIIRCQVPLQFDSLTEGDGNCMPRSIFQQCQREDVKRWLLENKPSTVPYSYSDLRQRIVSFALSESDEKVRTLRINFESVVCKSWFSYWRRMSLDGVWGDSTFLDVAAIYFGLDIKVLTTTSKANSPFLTISGAEYSTNEFIRPILYLGYYANVHYQSLIPKLQESTQKKSSQLSSYQVNKQINSKGIFGHAPE